MYRLYIYVAVLFIYVLFVNSQDPNITSSLGVIVGKTKYIPIGLPYENVHEYLGIPFAKPPVGERRFRKPEKITSLPSPFYAQSHGAYCPQVAIPEIPDDWQSEDCLHLNVYVPEQPADNQAGHAVMVWIYGGAFVQGAASQYDFSTLSLAGNIIVVTINYRVGIFGFLSTGDDHARGNYGLWDQHMALQWVHDYIKDFGGDNQRVTIAGESAGAMSVIQQGLTPDNFGLFQRMIAQSGSMSTPAFDLEKNGLQDAHVVGEKIGCKTDSAEYLMQCLREQSALDYISVLKDLGTSVMFAPVVDGELIKINPQTISKMSEISHLDEVEFFRSLDILSGFNANEGAMDFLYLEVFEPKKVEYFQPTREEMRKYYLPRLMELKFRKEYKSETLQLVEAQYTNWSNPNDYHSIRLQLEKLIGDVTFGVPAIEMARLHKMSSPSTSGNFMYHFAPKPSKRTLYAPSWVPGAGHADELGFILGAFGHLGVGEENAWENELIRKMMTYWTNFVKSGDPNTPEPMSPYWPEYGTDTGDYLVLDKSMSNSSAEQYFYAEEANFWLEVFPDIVAAVNGKGNCDGGPITSAASSLSVQGTVSLALVILLYIFS